MAMKTFTPSETDIVHRTRVDLILRPVQNTIHIVQYDDGLPLIEVELYRNGSVYTLPEGANVWLRWGVKDYVYTRKLTMVSTDRTKVYFRVTYNMDYFYGNVNPILVVEVPVPGEETTRSAGSSVILVTIDKNPIQYAEGPAAPEDEILEEIQNKLVNFEDELDAKTEACMIELDEKTETCKTQIQNKTNECIESIPSDYTALEGRVTALEENYDRFEWEIMLQSIRNGHGDNYHTGDQLLINWKDHTNNNLYNNVEHNIVDHSNAIVKINGIDTTVSALTLEWHYTIPFGLAFDPAEDLMQVGTNGMPAGRYFFKVSGDSWGGNNGKYYAFIVPANLSSGNRLRPNNAYNALMNTGKMIVTTNGQSFDALYTLDIVETTSEDTGIYLGTMWSTSDVGNAATYLKQDSDHNTYLNHYHRVVFGYNRWRDSLYRQWLNAEGTGWWTEQNIFDRAPSNIASLSGFLTGYSSQFKNVLRPTKISTYRNTVTDDGGIDITYDKIFLRSMANMNVDGFSTQQNTGGSEGPNWEYYQNLAIGQSNLNANGTFKAWATYSILIKYALNAKTSAQYVFSRAAGRGGGGGVLFVNTSGSVNGSFAGHGNRCLPACIIS